MLGKYFILFVSSVYHNMDVLDGFTVVNISYSYDQVFLMFLPESLAASFPVLFCSQRKPEPQGRPVCDLNFPGVISMSLFLPVIYRVTVW